jgi:hypothetical protein
MSQLHRFYFPPPVPIIQPEPPALPIWRPAPQDHRIRAFLFLRENFGVVADPFEESSGRKIKKRRLNQPSFPRLSHLHCIECDPYQKVIKVEDPLGKILY